MWEGRTISEGLTCWVALPLRPADASQYAPLGLLPFVLTATQGESVHLVRQGQCPLTELPAASRTVGVLPACDVLLVAGQWPQLEKIPPQRLREALPNLLEEFVLQPPEQCHFALSAQRPDNTWRTVAVVDQAWMRFLHDTFTPLGLRQLHLVPAQWLQAPHSVLGTWQPELDTTSALEPPQHRVLSWRDEPWSGGGLRLLETPPRLPFLAPLQFRAVAGFSATEEDSGAQATAHAPNTPPEAEEDAWLAQQQALSLLALMPRHESLLNLCQFDFAPPMGELGILLRPWRGAVLWALIVLLLQGLALNLTWAKLAWQQHHLEQTMHTLVQGLLPQAPAGLAPRLALRHALESMRASEDGVLPGSFPALMSQLNTLLANEASVALAQVDYREEALWLRFKPGFAVTALEGKAQQMGLVLQRRDSGQWRLSAS